jgi:hypothetical protein
MADRLLGRHPMGLLGCAPDGRRFRHRCRQCGLFLGGFSRSPGPAQFEDGGVKLPETSRENLSPAAGERTRLIYASGSCRSLRPSELRLVRSDRWLPPFLDISLGYTCGIGITAGLLTVYIRYRLRQAIL